MKTWIVPLFLLPSLAVAAASCPSLMNRSLPALMGGQVRLCDYAQQPVLVVNTASRCGFTPQFTGLQKLFETYKSRGLMIIGVPSNDFYQELESAGEIGSFCQANYGVSFPMTGKLHVRGGDADPFFKDLIKATGESPSWNFHKYLVLPDGKVKAFGTRTPPESDEIVNAFLPYLKPAAPAGASK
ncbi:glutathione peroxidase [Paludibacterium paludis]|uniref:Glutathione peroxidase n=2 Tax=Paludibacterium paludis TaxID=1225769 RepID=A0A918U7H8_9NEIS|nr:glutathione peroxidase [Paludibacterium paludis]